MSPSSSLLTLWWRVHALFNSHQRKREKSYRFLFTYRSDRHRSTVGRVDDGNWIVHGWPAAQKLFFGSPVCVSALPRCDDEQHTSLKEFFRMPTTTRLMYIKWCRRERESSPSSPLSHASGAGLRLCTLWRANGRLVPLPRLYTQRSWRVPVTDAEVIVCVCAAHWFRKYKEQQLEKCAYNPRGKRNT